MRLSIASVIGKFSFLRTRYQRYTQLCQRKELTKLSRRI